MSETATTGQFSVLTPGPFTIIVDDGRRGRGHQGVARSGAIDQASRALANRLVGNAPNAAVLEILLGPLEVVFSSDTFLAVTGARSEPTVGGTPVGLDCAVRVRAGERLRVPVSSVGLRAYLSVRGGIATPQLLGSRSYDMLGRIGSPPLVAGDVVPLGSPAACGQPWLETVPVAPLGTEVDAEITLGPRQDWISDTSLKEFLHAPWRVRPDSDRTGIRLDGPVLDRVPVELPSEAMIPGAIQVPAGGLPIVLGPDCGTTGGYPVVGVVVIADIGRIGQLRPGEIVRFHVRK